MLAHSAVSYEDVWVKNNYIALVSELTPFKFSPVGMLDSQFVQVNTDEKEDCRMSRETTRIPYHMNLYKIF